MMPIDSVEKASDMSKLPLDSVGKTTGIAMRVFQPTEKAENVNKMPTDLQEDVPEFSKVSLTRIKRQILKGTGCPEGHAKMWKGGRCVTCAVYMDHMNTDECPGDSSR